MKTIFISGLLVLISAGTNAQSGNRLLKNVRKEIEAADLIFSDLICKRDSSVAALYADNACLFPSGRPPVTGKEEIRKFYARFPKVQIKLVIRQLYGDAKEYITEESYYEMADAKGNTLDEGNAIVVWKKTVQGWKMYRDMFSSDGKIKAKGKE